MRTSDTNDILWNALVELFLKPDRIHSLIAPSPENDLNALKKELTAAERDQKTIKEKQERLLNLYLEGNIPQASVIDAQICSSGFTVTASAT